MAELTKIKDMFRAMGTEKIFAVENYTNSDNVKTKKKHTEILRCLYKCLEEVEFQMKHQIDAVKEMNKRKEILITFAHERGLEEQKEKSEKCRFEEEQKIAKAKINEKRWYKPWDWDWFRRTLD